MARTGSCILSRTYRAASPAFSPLRTATTYLSDLPCHTPSPKLDRWPNGPISSAATAAAPGTRSSTAPSASSCYLGNAALQERRDAWRLAKKKINYAAQCRSLTEIRADDPDGIGQLDVAVTRGALKRVHRSMVAFFKRCKIPGVKPGYPRFKSHRRYKTIEITDVSDAHVHHDGQQAVLRIKGLPSIRLRLRQTLPAERPRTIRITRRNRGVTVDLVYRHDPSPLPQSAEPGGVDVGTRKWVTVSTGEKFDSEPEDWKAIRRAQRAIARSKRRSARRRKRVAALARMRYRAAVRRRNALHRITTALVRRFGTFVIEALNLENMTKSARGTVEDPGRNVAAKAALNRRKPRAGLGPPLLAADLQGRMGR